MKVEWGTMVVCGLGCTMTVGMRQNNCEAVELRNEEYLVDDERGRKVTPVVCMRVWVCGHEHTKGKKAKKGKSKKTSIDPSHRIFVL